jgi:hypothetical protein
MPVPRLKIPTPPSEEDAARLRRFSARGDLAEILRAGSPVHLDPMSSSVPHHLRGRRATVHRIDPMLDLGVPLASIAVDGCEQVVLAGLDSLWLDLTDPTGAIHGLWWLLRSARRPDVGAWDSLLLTGRGLVYAVHDSGGRAIRFSARRMPHTVYAPALDRVYTRAGALAVAIAAVDASGFSLDDLDDRSDRTGDLMQSSE